MKFRVSALILAAVVIAIGIGAWLGGQREKLAGGDSQPPSKGAASKPVATPLPPPPPAAGKPPEPVAQPTPPAPMAATASPSAPKPAAPPVPLPPGPIIDLTADTRAEVENISFMFRDFRSVMGENPVGTNAEIMAAINGGNPKQARLGREGQKLNDKGELIDPWGTPYFFHQMTSTHMEIQSAGPDKIHGTSDDIKGR